MAPKAGRCKLLIEGEDGRPRFVDLTDVRIPMPALARFDLHA